MRGKKYTYYKDIQKNGTVIMSPYNPPEILFCKCCDGLDCNLCKN